MSLSRRLSLLALAGLALASGGCTETDLGRKAKEDVNQIDQDAQRQVQQLNQGPQESQDGY